MIRNNSINNHGKCLDQWETSSSRLYNGELLHKSKQTVSWQMLGWFLNKRPIGIRKRMCWEMHLQVNACSERDAITRVHVLEMNTIKEDTIMMKIYTPIEYISLALDISREWDGSV